LVHCAAAVPLLDPGPLVAKYNFSVVASASTLAWLSPTKEGIFSAFTVVVVTGTLVDVGDDVVTAADFFAVAVFFVAAGTATFTGAEAMTLFLVVTALILTVQVAPDAR
jgi:hypothetical protein